MEPTLPPNWRAAKAADGKEYYFHEVTGATSWTLPTAEDEPAKVVALTSGGGEDAPAPATSIAIDGGGGGGGMASMPPAVEEQPPTRADLASVAGPDPDLQAPGPAPGPMSSNLGGNLAKCLVILVASFVVMLASGIQHGRNGESGSIFIQNANLPWFSYAVALSVISIGFTLIFLLMAKHHSNFQSISLNLPLGATSLPQLYSGFMVLWWGIGTGLLTFHKPYTYTGNAYFASWACLIASLLMCVSTFNRVKHVWETINGEVTSSSASKSLLLLLIAAVTLIFASADYVKSSGQGVWGLCCGLFSVFFILVFAWLRKSGKGGPAALKFLSLVLFFMWAIAAGILTFDYPFVPTGNGFFACWVGVFCSASVLYQEVYGQEVQWAANFRRSFSLDANEHV